MSAQPQLHTQHDGVNVLLHPAAAEARELGRLADLLTAGRLAPTASEAITPHALLTTKQVLAARPGLTRSWLYENAAACGAIRKNLTRRSPLWFRLPGLDAELARRAKAAMDVVEPLKPAGDGANIALRAVAQGSRTAKGSPRSFQIRPRRER